MRRVVVSRAAALAVLLLAGLAGCIESSPPNPSPEFSTTTGPPQELSSAEYHVIFNANDSVPAKFRWELSSERIRFLTGLGTIRDAEPVRFLVESQAGETESSAIFLQDVADAMDLAVITDCEPPLLSCDAASIEWALPEGPFAWFGSSALLNAQRSDEKTLSLRIRGQTFHHTITAFNESLLRLEPPARTLRHADMCNILDDLTWVNLSIPAVVECHPRLEPEIRYGLANYSTRPRRTLETVPDSLTAFGPLVAAAGPLPPGANVSFDSNAPAAFTLEFAHRIAQEKSEALRIFLRDHPEASFEDAALNDRGESNTAVGLRATNATYTLWYFGAGGAGREIKVRETKTYVQEQLISTDYDLPSDVEKVPPKIHVWPKMRPLPKLASIPSFVERIAWPPGWYLDHLTVHNVAAGPSLGHADYGYYYHVYAPACKQTQDCKNAAILTAAAIEGRLVSAYLSGEVIETFFMPEEEPK